MNTKVNTKKNAAKKAASSVKLEAVKNKSSSAPLKADKSAEFWKEGIQFQCQGSGNCCVSRGEYGFVFLSLLDRKRFAKYFKIRTAEFTKKYCQNTKGAWHLKEEPSRQNCIFLKGKQCGTYEARPTQCRTWPFWPEVMNAKTWKAEVASFCPGVGKGKVYTANEIQEQLHEQIQAEDSIIREAARSK